MKKVKILGFKVALLLTVAFTTSFFGNTQSVFAQSSALEQMERATFETDSVIVTFTKEATNRFLEYSAESFSEIGCIDIEDLTESTVVWVRSRASGQQTKERMMIDTEQFKRILRLELRESSEESVLRAIKMLEEREDVLSASPNYIYSIDIAPNDTHYVHSDQWGLNGNRGVRAEESWNITRGANIVNVGVMDTGIQANHPDLTNRISNEGLHRDCTVSPIATVATPNDPNGHGTHVAGIIGAQGNNNVGIAGVAWDVRLISLRVFDANGNGTLASIARAVNFAAGQNIPILNFSGGTTSNDTNIRNAIAGYTGLFVCAAGNGGPDGIGDNNDTTRHYPSDYSRGQTFSNRVISVGAINSVGNRANFSNFGAASVSVFAPGVNILSTFPQNRCTGAIHAESGFLQCEDPVPIGGRWFRSHTHHAEGYHIMDGTSMATPFVTGVAALMLAVNPTLEASTLKTVILNNVITDDAGTPLNGLNTSNGRLDAFRAVSSCAFSTTPTTGGMSITGLLPSFTLPNNTELVLPDRFDPGMLGLLTVNTIGNNAFSGVTQMSQISIPTSITSIGSSAFKNCTSLTKVILPNALTSIGDFAFNGCTRLSNIVLPIGLKSIGINSFSYCSSLTNIILPNTLTSIGAVAFNNCSGLKTMVIPDSVTSIGNIAFAYCINLENVTFQKETANITQIGTSVFVCCDKLNEIIVPTNRIAEYKNQENWSTYSHLIVPSTEFDEHKLNCFSNFNITTSLEAGYNKLYKLEVECPKSYKIVSNSSSAIKTKLYDSNMNLISTSNEIITSYLSPGIYYLDLSFIDDLSSGDINTSFGLLWVHNGWDVSYNTNNDVLQHLHEIEPNVYKNKLRYYNDEGAGFYEFYLEGTNIGESIPYYKEGAITIYSDSSRNNILSKFVGYSTEAQTNENINRMVVYLPRDGYFYIDINMTSNSFTSLDLRINPLVNQEVNLFNLAENTDESINIFNETTYGEYFQKLKINQAGKFTVYASYFGFQNNTLFVLAKLNYNPTLDTYTLETKIADILSAKDYPVPKTLTLDEGTYYIGYFNKFDDLSLNVSINRLVTLSGSQVLLSDPEVGALCGSQINIIEMNESIKSYRETYITKNFTRILYPNYNYIYQTSSSRLDYNWYSSNENIATVTPYGTVLGKNVGTVKIMAVLKTDPSKVFVKEFTIINDTGTEPLVVNSTLIVNYSKTDNGTFKLNLEKVNCPYPWFQDYTWSVFIPEQYNDLIVDIDVWGNTTINKTGSFELTGTYLKNSRVTVKINVIIEP